MSDDKQDKYNSKKDHKCSVQIKIKGKGKAVGRFIEQVGKSIRKAHNDDKTINEVMG